MEGLPDDLLVEICCRVPCKIAVRCKSISKRFLALISSHSFIERFTYYKHTLVSHINKEEHQKDWFLIFLTKHCVFILQPKSHIPDYAASDLSNPSNHWSLRFLDPQFDRSWILGCSNGLLLLAAADTRADGDYCSYVTRADRDYSYYVCNPITKDCVKLPPPGHRGFYYAFEGFVCEPYYHVEGDKVSVRSCHRFRVVLVFPKTFTSRHELRFSIFSSETGLWSSKFVSCPKGFDHSDSVARVGTTLGERIYFQGRRSLLVCHPFNDDDMQCQTIDYPIGFYTSNATYRYFARIGVPRGHLGVSCGNLRICEVNPIQKIISVWELKEEGSVGWHLLLRTSFPPIIRMLAFHPTHGDVVFFQCGNHLKFFGNLKTKQIQTVYGHDLLQTTSLDMLWWPTPIPSVK